MLRPKRTKFNKFRKIRIKRTEQRQTNLKFGSYGLKTLGGGQISSRQIEAVRRVITRKLKRTGKLWIRIFPNIPVTKKPVSVRMGKGKGAVDHWVAVVKPGAVLFEINGLNKEMAYKVLKLASYKLPIKTKILEKA